MSAVKPSVRSHGILLPDAAAKHMNGAMIMNGFEDPNQELIAFETENFNPHDFVDAKFQSMTEKLGEWHQWPQRWNGFYPDKSSAFSTQKVEDPRKSILSILCPLLKFFGGGDAAAPRNALLETATTGVSSIARLPWGSQVLPEVAAARAESGQPPQLFQLYEFEACPFCRRVREALTELDLSAEVYPCPKGSIRHREFVRSVGGREQFPYFLDPNTGVSMYESSDIVRYLFSKYGQGRQPSPGLLESTLVTGWVPTLMRAGRGMSLYARATLQPPHKKLELFSYENNQFARLVRETLCELELPYILRNSGKGSSCRPALLQIAGSTKVPFLVDPNTGVSMGESKDIIAYLFQTYGGSTPNPVAG
ncbi:unnamed protein product [Sphagnum balticum]